MSLRVVWTREEALVSSVVERTLREGLAREGRAVLLVPSFAQQLEASRQLASLPGLSLGVTVGVAGSWAKGLWEVWGDGRRPVEDGERSLLMHQLLREEGSSVGQGAGTVRLLSQLARLGLPWVRGAKESGDEAIGLTRAERDALDLVLRYAHRLSELGLVEESEMLCQLPGMLSQAGALPATLVLAGAQELSCAQRDLLLGLAEACSVSVVLSARNEVVDMPAHALVERLGKGLGGSLRQEGPDSPRREGAGMRADELTQLRDRLFLVGEEPIAPTGAVSLLHPAGPLAEAESVARRLSELAAAGSAHIVLAAPDAARVWRELAPKLCARKISCSGVLPVPVAGLEQGRALIGFVSSVARLADLSQGWPQREEDEEGSLVRLGDMSWWPPSELVDFLLSDISGVPASRVYRLDASWRGRRLLSPADVLLDLQNPKKTSAEVSRATRELLKGHLAACASTLLGAYTQKRRALPADSVLDDYGETVREEGWPADALAVASGEAALGSAMAAAGCLRDMGIGCAPAAEGGRGLGELADTFLLLMGGSHVVLRPQLVLEGSGCRVDIMPLAQASRLEPLSADAVVAMGQSSDESALGGRDDVLASLLELISAEPRPDELARARSCFHSLASVARERLVLERTLFDASSKDRFPSVMLTELLSCYGAQSESDAGRLGLAIQGLGEAAADANCAPSGMASLPEGSEGRLPAGVIGEEARPLVVVPNEGNPHGFEGMPLLSASQIESYLECPYKWFSLRRLRLRDVDAGFTPMEMGTFAHRVLEVTHRTLLDEARAAAGQDVSRPLDDLSAHLAGSRLSLDDRGLLAHAHEVLGAEFDLHLKHQFLHQPRSQRQQLLIPHTEMDRGILRSLRQDLLTVLDFEAGLFEGFEPRLMEWDFGRGGELVEYAGVYINGTVDRVDVDAHGNAVVIDYKHKSPNGFVDEYALFPRGREEGAPFSLPRRVQSLIYGQVVRKAYPELSVRAAVYLGSKGDHAVSGAVSENLAERVFGTHPLSKAALARVAVPEGDDFGVGECGFAGECGIDAVLDATERLVSQKIEEMLAGNIEARPLDDKACSYCPVMNCEKRRSK